MTRLRKKGPRQLHDRTRRVVYVVEYDDPAERVQIEAIFATKSAANARARKERKADRREGIDTNIRVAKYVPAPETTRRRKKRR